MTQHIKVATAKLALATVMGTAAGMSITLFLVVANALL